MACIIFHKWDSCKCRKCGAVRDQNHKWSGCICQVCGKENHDYIDCKCRKCGAVRDQNHKWSGCICQVCGKGNHHEWGCRCCVCGKESHEYIGCKCHKCAKDISLCFGKFYEYREINDCAKCSVKQLCMDQYKSKFAELEKRESEERLKYKGMYEELEERRKWEKEKGARIAELRRISSQFDGWSGWLNIGGQNGVRTNYEHFCTFARRNPPSFPMHVQHAVLDGTMHVLAILYPNSYEDSSFDGDMVVLGGHDLLRVAEMAGRDTERKKQLGGNSIGPYMENYLRTNPNWLSNFGFSQHSFYSGTKRVKEYCKRVTQILDSIEV